MAMAKLGLLISPQSLTCWGTVFVSIDYQDISSCRAPVFKLVALYQLWTPHYGLCPPIQQIGVLKLEKTSEWAKGLGGYVQVLQLYLQRWDSTSCFLCCWRFSYRPVLPPIVPCRENRAALTPTVYETTSLVGVTLKSIFYLNVGEACATRKKPYSKTLRNNILDIEYCIDLPFSAEPIRPKLSHDTQSPSTSELNFLGFVHTMPVIAQNIVREADPVNLVNRMLPHTLIDTEAEYLGSCFWACLCVVDGRRAHQKFAR